MSPDDAYLLDMLAEARDAREYLAGLGWEQFERDRVLQRAIVNALQNIGEAAAKVTQETRAAYPEIPWDQIVNMRHRLVHGYRSINMATVWTTAQDDLAPLIALLEPRVPPEDAQP